MARRYLPSGVIETSDGALGGDGRAAGRPAGQAGKCEGHGRARRREKMIDLLSGNQAQIEVVDLVVGELPGLADSGGKQNQFGRGTDGGENPLAIGGKDCQSRRRRDARRVIRPSCEETYCSCAPAASPVSEKMMVLPSADISASRDQSNQERLRSRVAPGGRAEMPRRALSAVNRTRPVRLMSWMVSPPGER